jgi:soluble P-type ATPase
MTVIVLHGSPRSSTTFLFKEACISHKLQKNLAFSQGGGSIQAVTQCGSNGGDVLFRLDISGFKRLELKYLVLDYNGTLALDGELVEGVADLIRQLEGTLEIHVLTADTRGRCADRLRGLPVRLSILETRPEDQAKLEYVRKLGGEATACLGNGRNDRLMLRAAALGVAVVGGEGAAGTAVLSADVVVTGIVPALNLFLEPLRLLATLRS